MTIGNSALLAIEKVTTETIAEGDMNTPNKIHTSVKKVGESVSSVD